MTELIVWVKEILLNYPAFQYLLVLVGTGLGGDFMLIALAFLCAQGFLPLWVLLVFSFIGTFISDTMLFLLGRTKLLHNLISHKYTNKTTSVIVASLLRTGRGNHMLALTIAKFLIGTRVVIMLYADKIDIHFKKFSYYNAVATFIWVVAVVPIGYLLGLGLTYFSHIFKNIYAGLGIVAILLMLIALGEVWFEKKFTKE